MKEKREQQRDNRESKNQNKFYRKYIYFPDRKQKQTNKQDTDRRRFAFGKHLET